MLIATDFLWVGFSSPKTFNLRCMPPPPVILRGAEWRSRRIHPPKNNPFIPGEEGRSQMVGEGPGRALSPTPHLSLSASSPQGEGCSSQSAAMDSATSGKPCVQNDMSEG